MKLIKNLTIKTQLEVLTVGFPFCGFKIITGILFVHEAFAQVVTYLGYILITLGLIDLLMNGCNFIWLTLKKKRLFDPCFAGFLSRILNQSEDFGNSIDILISFSLVALVVGAGLIPRLHTEELHIWNICVVINVLGAGLGRFT